MYGTLQARHTAASITRLAACLYVGKGRAEDRCRRSTCQEIFGDLTSKRDTPYQLLTNGSKRNMFLTTAISRGTGWHNARQAGC